MKNPISNPNSSKKLRVRQDQVLSLETFQGIVRDEIDKYFDEKYLTDQRVPMLINEYKACTAKELKEEMYDLFFKSFYEVCINVKNMRLASNVMTIRNELVPVFVSIDRSIRSTANDGFSTEKLNELKKLSRIENDLHIRWYSSYTEIDSYEVNAKGQQAREAYKRLTGKAVRLDEEGYLDIKSKKIRINLRIMYVYFYGLALVDINAENENELKLTLLEEEEEQAREKQVIKYKTPRIVRYQISLYERIRLIVDHVLYRHIFGPIIEQCRGLKYKTPEQRCTYDNEGNQVTEWDIYGIAKTIVNDWIRQFNSDEQKIWRPEINKWRSDDSKICIE